MGFGASESIAFASHGTARLNRCVSNGEGDVVVGFLKATGTKDVGSDRPNLYVPSPSRHQKPRLGAEAGFRLYADFIVYAENYWTKPPTPPSNTITLDEDREAVTSRLRWKLSVRVSVRTFMPTPKRRSSERSLH